MRLAVIGAGMGCPTACTPQSIRQRLPELGDLKLIQCEYSPYSSRYPAFRAGQVLPAFDPAMGGGALMDLEFRAFERMIRTLNLAERDTRLDHSHLVLDLATEALASAGIRLEP